MWTAGQRDLWVYNCDHIVQLPLLDFYYFTTLQCVKAALFSCSFTNRSGFRFSKHLTSGRWLFQFSWVFSFILASNTAFLFNVVLIHMYFMSEVEHILAAAAAAYIYLVSGNPLQYSCLENPMGGGAWWAAVCGVGKNRTRLSGFTFTFHFHALEKEMATHSSVLVWRIPGTGEPGGLPSMGSHRVGHD